MPGDITTKASMVFEGALRPIAGEITFKSVPTKDVLLFDETELDTRRHNQLTTDEKSSSPVNQELKIRT